MRAYETYQRTPPNEIVERMVVCFHAPQLAYQHLHETTKLVSQIIPKLEARSILEVAVRIYNQMRSFSQGACLERLMAIAEDVHMIPKSAWGRSERYFTGRLQTVAGRTWINGGGNVASPAELRKHYDLRWLRLPEDTI